MNPSWALHSHDLTDSYTCSVAQLCPTLCSPIDCSPPGSSVHGILQARILEWAAMSSSSRGPSWPRDWAQFPASGGGFFTTASLGKSLLLLSAFQKHHMQYKHWGLGLPTQEFKGTWCSQSITVSVYPLPIYQLSVPIRLFLSSFCESREQFQIFIHNKEELCEHTCIL